MTARQNLVFVLAGNIARTYLHRTFEDPELRAASWVEFYEYLTANVRERERDDMRRSFEGIEPIVSASYENSREFCIALSRALIKSVFAGRNSSDIDSIACQLSMIY